jgi:hypothetical protein
VGPAVMADDLAPARAPPRRFVLLDAGCWVMATFDRKEKILAGDFAEMGTDRGSTYTLQRKFMRILNVLAVLDHFEVPSLESSKCPMVNG